jgi:hypothetical protein
MTTGVIFSHQLRGLKTPCFLLKLFSSLSDVSFSKPNLLGHGRQEQSINVVIYPAHREKYSIKYI